MATKLPIPMSSKGVADFCRRWKITQLALFGRKVDLVSKQAIERNRNALRRKAILDSAEVIYAQS